MYSACSLLSCLLLVLWHTFAVPKKRKRTAKRNVTRRASSRKQKKRIEALELKTETRRHIAGFVQIALAIVFFLVISGRAGLAGGAVQNLLAFFFGSASAVLPFALLVSGLQIGRAHV